MKRLTLIVAVVASTILIVAATLSAQNQPRVTKAVAPFMYPPVALAARQSGKAIVEVKINPAGDVVSAKGVQCPPLLVAAALEPARLWEFEAGVNDRAALLTFSFPPYEVEFISAAPRIVN
jgi:outer membrane biosynthesis protein TonB